MSEEYDLPSIQNPEDFSCEVFSYTHTHNQLLIEASRISDRSQKIYMHFRKVLFFSGLLLWKGARLRIASDDEYLHIMRNMEVFQDITDEDLIDPYMYGKLYVFEADKQRIQIIAKAATASRTPWRVSESETESR
jgi:hypothetical protein